MKNFHRICTVHCSNRIELFGEQGFSSPPKNTYLRKGFLFIAKEKKETKPNQTQQPNRMEKYIDR